MTDTLLLAYEMNGDERLWDLHVTTVPLVNELNSQITRLTKERDELLDFIRSIHEGPWASMMSAAESVPEADPYGATVAFPVSIVRDWNAIIAAKLTNADKETGG